MSSRSILSLVACAGLVGVGLLAAAPAPAPTARQDQPADEGKATTADFDFAKRLSRVFRTVAEQCEPSVVHVTRLEEMLVRRSRFDRGEPRIVENGVGSGVIVRDDGIVVTNYHVVQGAETQRVQLKVKMSDGRELGAEVIDVAPANDLAVLKIDGSSGEKFSALSFADSDSVEVGEWVVAIGSPFGLDNSVTQGIVSAKGRTVSPRETGMDYKDYLQTDAAINPGNSGGPLLNLEGQVVGINSAIASASRGYDGIGFAIPSNVVKSVVDNVLTNGKFIRGFLGMEFAEAENGTPGAIVNFVQDDGPADRAGLHEGDVITKLNGSPVNEGRLRAALSTQPPGTGVKLEVLRGGQPRNITATLADFDTVFGIVASEKAGISVQPLTPRLVDKLGYSRALKGVLVTAVRSRSPAAGELLPGDIIVEVDNQPVRDAKSFVRTVEDADFARGVRLAVIRGRLRGAVELRE